MDEITPDNGLPQIEVDGSDNNPLYALIDGLIEAGALELFSVAPFWRLKQTEFNDIVVEALPALFNNANGSPKYIIRLKVPDDFLRVAEIKGASRKEHNDHGLTGIDRTFDNLILKPRK